MLLKGADVVGSHLREYIVVVGTKDLKVLVHAEAFDGIELGIELLVLSS